MTSTGKDGNEPSAAKRQSKRVENRPKVAHQEAFGIQGQNEIQQGRT